MITTKRNENEKTRAFHLLAAVCAVLFIAALFCGAGAAANVAKVVGGSEYTTLAAAIAAAPAGGTVQLIADANYESTAAINVDKNLTLDLNGKKFTFKRPSGSGFGFIDVKKGTLTLTDSSAGANGQIYSNREGACINVLPTSATEYGTFIMEKGTISGFRVGVCATGYNANGSHPTVIMNGGTVTDILIYGIQLFSGADFTMNGGTISNIHATDDSGRYGSAITTYVNNGYPKVTVTMTGGIIENCSTATYGGAVALNHGGNEAAESLPLFTMTGGTIRNCSAGTAGGAVGINCGTFDMKGGTIEGCTAATNGGGVYAAKSNAKFLMSGTAKITGCKANGTADNNGGGGVYVNSGSFTMSGGSITGCEAAGYGSGGGVCVYSGTFTMSDGTIGGTGNGEGCTALRGGGVLVSSFGTFTMNGTAKIIGCKTTTYSGGGVVVTKSGSFTMSGSAEIKDCISYKGGGGVLVNNDGTFAMSGGSITGCVANGTPGEPYGGGVYIYNGSFTMSGGSITGCTATYGSGVFLSGNCPFTISGTALVDKSNAVYLNSGKTITYGGAFTSDTAGVYNIVSVDTTAGTTIVTASSGTIPTTKFRMGDVAYALSNTGTALVIASPVAKVIEPDTSSAYATANDAFEAAQATAAASSADGVTVELTADSTMTGEITVTKKVTLDLKGKTLTAASSQRLFTVSSSTGNFTLTDTSTEANGQLKGNGSISGSGGGVRNNGTFTMSGGSITGCTGNSGGGVYLGLQGKFTMSGGSIAECTATENGGGVYVNKGEFTMSDTAKITSCEASNRAGGVCVMSGSFTMSDTAKITSCEASNRAGGVYVNNGCTFTMTGGSITGCTGSYGGGVYSTGTFTMSGGSITGCTGNLGVGGVSNGGTFTMSGGSITGCTGKYGGAAGVQNDGTFTMSGGSITGCTGNNGCGGGVYVGGGDGFSSTTFNISGNPDITGNTKAGAPNNVCLVSSEEFSEEFEEFLEFETLITIAGALTEGAKIGITTEVAPTAKVPVVISAAVPDDISTAFKEQYKNIFVSDDETRAIGYNPDDKTLIMSLAYTVAYDANGGDSGTVPEDDEVYAMYDKVTVLGSEDLKKGDQSYYAWNDLDDISYDDGSTFIITKDTTSITTTKTPATQEITLKAIFSTDRRHKHDAGETEEIIFRHILNNVENIKTGDVELKSGDYTLNADMQLAGTITIPENAKVNICLDGYKLTAAEGKRAFRIIGDLTFYDCREESDGGLFGCGTVTDLGGAFFVDEGHLTIESGKITGFTAGYGPAVYAASGLVALAGGEITANTANAADSGAVYVTGGAVFNVKGTPAVKGNTGGSIYLAKNGEEPAAKITLGVLGDGAELSLNQDASGVTGGSTFTTGWSTQMGTANPAAYFKAEDGTSLAAVNAGEVYFKAYDGYKLLAGTTVEITGDRIGYAGVTDTDLDLLANARAAGLAGVRTGYSDTYTYIVSLPASYGGQNLEFDYYGNICTIPVEARSLTGGNITDAGVWTGSIGDTLSFTMTQSGAVKYVGLPVITNKAAGGIELKPAASEVVVKDAGTQLVSGTDYTTGTQADGSAEIILASPVIADTYTYTYEGGKLGDVNGDGKINLIDALLVCQYDADLAHIDDARLIYADANNNGRINIADSSRISAYYLTH